MAQLVNRYGGPSQTLAKNLEVTSGATETIVLDNVAVFGTRNISVTIVNYSGSISAVALYGSPDGVNWTTASISGFSTFTVAAGAVGHAECTGVWQFLRVTTTGAATVDAYLYAV